MTPSPSSLWQALVDHADPLERTLVRVGQLIGFTCAAASATVTLAFDAPMGPPLFALSTGLFATYSLAAALWRHPQARWVARHALPLFEAGVPSLVMAWMAFTQGPAYALGSWVPPQLAAIFIFGNVLRLREAVPVVIAALAAAAHLAVFYAAVAPAGPADGNLLHRPEMQWVRAASLLATGVAAAWLVRSLKTQIDAADEAVGAMQHFGRYRLGRDIASGGMGRVVEAIYAPEVGFERRVALKLVHPHLATDARFIERFRLEAALCGRLHHPGIVAALDVGRARGTWYFAMEYVDGRSLQDILVDYRGVGQPLPAQVIVALGLQLADALDHAHRSTDANGQPLRIVHRDVTPSNILLDRSGQFKLTDWGVARALGDSERLITKNLVGKPSYVAPEVLRDGVVDGRADLWSLGVVLFEALTHHRPFKRSTEAATLLAVLEQELPTIGTLRADISSRWQPFFEVALARDPHARFRDAAAMRAALLRLEADEGRASPEFIASILGFGDEELPLERTTGESAPTGTSPTPDGSTG